MYPHRGTVRDGHELNAFSRQSNSCESIQQAGVNGRVRQATLGAAAQNDGVARFEAQRPGIGRHVGTALVDDADDTERYAHPVECASRSADPTRPRPSLPDQAARRFPRCCGQWLRPASHPGATDPATAPRAPQRPPRTCPGHWLRGFRRAAPESRRRHESGPQSSSRSQPQPTRPQPRPQPLAQARHQPGDVSRIHSETCSDSSGSCPTTTRSSR